VSRLATWVGVAAALCTTASYLPQVLKTWRTQETGDLSRRMLVLLATGVGLWCLYGVLLRDAVIVAANAASLGMLVLLLYWKVRIG
jgi:MtN3 and saliva related transmembrane protein